MRVIYQYYWLLGTAIDMVILEQRWAVPTQSPLLFYQLESESAHQS